MRTAYSVETVRNTERELMARLPEGALMQRAAAGLAAACADLLGGGSGVGPASGSAAGPGSVVGRRVYGSKVVVLAGSGANGGDALYAGARLAARGARVSAVLLAPDRTHEGGLSALLGKGGRVVDDPFEVLAVADLVLDGITGIGGHGGCAPTRCRWRGRRAGGAG